MVTGVLVSRVAGDSVVVTVQVGGVAGFTAVDGGGAGGTDGGAVGVVDVRRAARTPEPLSSEPPPAVGRAVTVVVALTVLVAVTVGAGSGFFASGVAVAVAVAVTVTVGCGLAAAGFASAVVSPEAPIPTPMNQARPSAGST